MNFRPGRKWLPDAEGWAMLGLISVAAMQLSRIGNSFWHDETGLVAEIQGSFAQLLEDYIHRLPMLSIFEAFMWAWGRCFGFSEIAMRSPSVIFGVVTLIFLYRTARNLTSTYGATLVCLILLCIEPMAFVNARPYAMTMAFLSASIHQWVAFSRTGAKRHWMRSCAAGAMAGLTKVFALEGPLLLLAGGLLFRKSRAHIFTRLSLKAILAGLSMLGLAILVQIPLVMHFYSRSALHSYAGPLPAQWLLEFLVYSILPPGLMVLLVASLALRFSARGNHSRNETGLSSQLIVFAGAAIIPSVVHYLIYRMTGSFVVHRNYIIAAFLPAALAIGLTLFSSSTAKRWQHFMFWATFVISIFGSMTYVPPENWRRAVNLINARYDSRSSIVLVQAGFYENAHPELLDLPLLAGPAIAYPTKGTVVSIPRNLSAASKEYIERVLNDHRLRDDPKPILIMARSPSIVVAEYIAIRLQRNIASLEQDGIIVFELYKNSR